uniref:Uncharacterized protein n=1 Tax=Lynx canadensis TaxID=61383 RepID=A0A667FN96_LYNCA
MYCDESEWFSWPWMRPSSLCGAGQVTGGQGRARPGARPPPPPRRSPGSPARRCAAASRPPPPCCPPPAGARPSPPPCSGGGGGQRGRGRVKARGGAGAGPGRGGGRGRTLHSASACFRRLSLSCVCSPLFCAARYCSFSCSAARSASTRFSRLRWMWS